MVKQRFRSMTTPVIDDRTGQIATEAPWEALTRKAITPGAGYERKERRELIGRTWHELKQKARR